MLVACICYFGFVVVCLLSWGCTVVCYVELVCGFDSLAVSVLFGDLRVGLWWLISVCLLFWLLVFWLL